MSKVEEGKEGGIIMSDKLTVFPTRGHLLKIDGKCYKLDKEEKDEEGRTVLKQVYSEITPEKYTANIEKMAERIALQSDVRIADIIEDALKELPLEKLMEVEESLNEIQCEPIRTAGCVELKIGKTFLILRE